MYSVCYIFSSYKLLLRDVGRDNSVGIAIRYGLVGDRIPVEARFSAPVQTSPGAHPASYTLGTESFPGVKRSGRGIDHPPPLA